jgi:hypothetical protein
MRKRRAELRGSGDRDRSEVIIMIIAAMILLAAFVNAGVVVLSDGDHGSLYQELDETEPLPATETCGRDGPVPTAFATPLKGDAPGGLGEPPPGTCETVTATDTVNIKR